MKFTLIDDILEQTDDRIVAVKLVSLAEEYLADHFPRFPVLPGVLMLETMVQAARVMLEARAPRLVLGSVKALKYGAMVRPGETLVVEVTVGKARDDGSFDCRGTGTVRRNEENSAGADETAVSGRFTMRPISVGERDHGHES
jgi:3-hydroxyacyl-[acyl-carrier-protein] dehydratase